jgi:hypothetical protein
MSMVVMAATVTAAVTGATYAPFTGEGNGNGPVKGGTVDVVMNDNPDDEQTFVFDGSNCHNLAQGESCSEPFSVKNAGNLSVRYNLVSVLDDNDACFSSLLDIEAALEAGDPEAGDNHDDHNEGDVHTGTLTTTLDGGQACENAENEVTVLVKARQSPSPHD